MSSTINIGIIGGAGYTGGELIRLLLHHPQANIVFVHSHSNAGNLLSNVHTDIVGDTDLRFTNTLNVDIDLLFLCVGHGDARKFLSDQPLADTIKIIDLSQDFRLQHQAQYKNKLFVYGLPELSKTAIQTAHYIANPGCFATAIQLGLLPLAAAGLLPNEVHTTGITGSTGAGQSLAASSHFSWRANNIQAYKTLTHQHLYEIHQSLQLLQPNFLASSTDATGIQFIPWRGDFTRGIFISSQIKCSWTLSQLQELYKNYYAQHPFTIVSEAPICLKQVVNTNKCVVQLEKIGNSLVVHTAIDNLLKGASGQALQNMNLMMGLDEQAGLMLKASGF
jgi:N-acetyl-gamma-glutamyl-phosphate reductase